MHHICHTKHAMLGVYIYIYVYIYIHDIAYVPGMNLSIIHIYNVYFSFLCRLCTCAPLLNRIGINDKYKLIKTGGRWTIKSIQWGSTSCWVPNAACWWVVGGPSSAGDVRHHIGCAQPWCAGDGARTQKFPQNGLPLVEWWAWKKRSWMVWSQGMSQHKYIYKWLQRGLGRLGVDLDSRAADSEVVEAQHGRMDMDGPSIWPMILWSPALWSPKWLMLWDMTDMTHIYIYIIYIYIPYSVSRLFIKFSSLTSQERLVTDKVISSDAFQWQSMLKSYWVLDENNEANAQMCPGTATCNRSLNAHCAPLFFLNAQ